MVEETRKSSYIVGMPATACVTVALYLLQQLFLPDNDAPGLRYAMALALAVIFAVSILRAPRGGRAEAVCTAVVLAGLVLRIGYMLYTDCTVRAHDLYINNEYSGHAEYVLNLIHRQLPPDYVGQRYQQPLFYLLGSALSALVNAILGRDDVHSLVDAAKLVSCLASCAILFLSDALCRECSVKGRGRALALALVAFSPSFFLVAGRVSCDALAAMFMVWELLTALRWYKNPSLANTVYSAAVFGFGVMTKISCGVMAPLMAVLMLRRLYQRRREPWPLVGRLALFGAISLPLGLWYNLRGYIKFGMPLGYVLPIPLNNSLYTGDRSIFSRLFYIDFSSLLDTPYAHPGDDFSAPVYFLKSALFGEFSYDVAEAIPYILLVFAVCTAALAVTAAGRLLSAGETQENTVCLIAAVLLVYVSMLLFYLRYPFGCSMDFRYAAAVIVPAALLVGQWEGRRPGWSLWSLLPVGGFCGASCLMYLLL